MMRDRRNVSAACLAVKAGAGRPDRGEPVCVPERRKYARIHSLNRELRLRGRAGRTVCYFCQRLPHALSVLPQSGYMEYDGRRAAQYR